MDQEEIARIEDRTRAVFDDSVGALDGATRSRLTQARHAALAELGSRRRAWASGWLPAGAAAGAALLALTLWTGGGDPAGGSPAFEDLELVSGGDLEMLRDDVEFYAWAADQLADGVG